MEVVIRDEKGNVDDEGGIPMWASVVVIILVSIIIFMAIPEQPLIATGLVFLCIILFSWGVLLEEKITFDKGIKSIIIEARTVNKKLKLEWKENKKIKFSDIKGIFVIEYYEPDTMGDYVRYYTTELIVFEGNGKSIYDDKTSEITKESSINLCSSGSNPESAKEFAIKLCKIISISGYYIDEKNNSSPLIEAT